MFDSRVKVAILGVCVVLLFAGVGWLFLSGTDSEAVLAVDNPTDDQITQIASLLSSDDLKLQARAATKLIEVGERSLPAVVKVATEGSRAVQVAALGIATRIKPEAAFDVIEGLLSSPDKKKRGAAMHLLNDAPEGPRRVALLAKALEDENAVIREAAAGQLGTTGSKAAIKPLRVALKDPERAVREHAANALFRITRHKPKIK